MLLKHPEINANITDKNGKTLLHLAVEAEDFETVKEQFSLREIDETNFQEQLGGNLTNFDDLQ